MRSVQVGVVGSAPGRAVGAYFERRADGRLVLQQIVTARSVVDAERPALPRQRWFRNLAALWERKRPDPHWIVGLSPSVAVVRRVAMPPLAPAQRDKLLAFEARQVMAAPPEDLLWAPAVFPASAGGAESVALGVARREAMERVAGAQEGAVRCVERYEPRSLALYRCFHYNYPAWSDRAVLIVDLGAEGRGFSVLLAEQGAFATRTAATGAGDKGGTAPAWSAANGAAATALAERIHLEAARLLASHEPARAAEPRVVIQAIFLTGDAAAQARVAGPLSERMGLPVERMDPFRRVEVLPGVAVEDSDERAAEWVGLAVPPSARCPALDLSPPSVREGRERRLRRSHVQAALLALVLAPVPPGCLALRESGRDLREAERLRGDVARLAPLAADLRSQQEETARLLEDAEHWRALHEASTRWVAFLDDLQQRVAVDGNVWLKSLETGAAGAGVARRLRVSGELMHAPGRSESASADAQARIEAVLAELSRSPWLEGIEQERFKLTPDQGLHFEAVFTLAEKPRP